MRRKTLRNALKPFGLPTSLTDHPWLEKRAEQLSVDEFEQLTCIYEEAGMLKK
jgi:16S rRNA (adenine1518-N6/adenine1519-N6)-dimethyltransferase